MSDDVRVPGDYVRKDLQDAYQELLARMTPKEVEELIAKARKGMIKSLYEHYMPRKPS